MREDLKVDRLAADEAAERDDGVIAPGVCEQRDRRGQLERTGDLEHGHDSAARRRALQRGALQSERDVLVPSRADDRHSRTFSPTIRGRAALNRRHR